MTLKDLNDEKLEEIQHLIRRDAMNDLDIAKKAEAFGLGSLGKTKHAKEMAVFRYRKSKAYRAWLTRWENRDLELRKELETQKQRFELISNLVQGDDRTGFDGVSKAIQARLLTLAAEANDEELKEAAGAKGWVAGMLKLVHEQAKMELKNAGEKVMEVSEDKKLTETQRRERLREIFKRAE